MSRRRMATAVAGVASAVALVGGAAGAAPVVTIDTVTVEGSTASVAGTATFDGSGDAVSVGGANTHLANPAAAPAGVDLVDALIQPLEDGSGLRFIWQLASLPAQAPPEVTRYTWGFAIGDATYQLQAKRTNLVSITLADDAPGHAAAMAGDGFFQLRGNCVAEYQGAPVANCPHIAWLDGAFDPANAQVTMDIPFATAEGGPVPELVPGAEIVEHQTASMSIAAAFQAVVSNTLVSDFINGWDPYFVGPQVDLAVGRATGFAEAYDYSAPATLDDGAFSGTVPGLTATNNTVYARACEAATCSYTKATP